jgi:hypothetical protein
MVDSTMPNYVSATVIARADIVQCQLATEALVQDSHVTLLEPNGDAPHPVSTKTFGTMPASCVAELVSQPTLPPVALLRTTNCATMGSAARQIAAMYLLHFPTCVLTLHCMLAVQTVPTVLIVMTDATALLISVCWIVVAVISTVELILLHTLRPSKPQPL